jgi:hypothetical protein
LNGSNRTDTQSRHGLPVSTVLFIPTKNGGGCKLTSQKNLIGLLSLKEIYKKSTNWIHCKPQFPSFTDPASLLIKSISEAT